MFSFKFVGRLESLKMMCFYIYSDLYSLGVWSDIWRRSGCFFPLAS